MVPLRLFGIVMGAVSWLFVDRLGCEPRLSAMASRQRAQG